MSIAFAQHWKLFQDKAVEVMSQGGGEQQVQKLLDSLTQLLFGLDESIKQKATNALDLIIQLVNSLSSKSEPIAISALKAIKSCVIRNSVGRQQCRAAGVFPFLNTTLNEYQEHALIVEEAMTTLAALSMSNDLNALQATMQFRTHVNTAATTFSKENYSSLHQKLKYLRALFDAMEGEQADLLTEGNELWTNVTKAEQDFKAAQQQSASSEWQLAVDLFAQALENVEQYTEKTKLLDPLQWQLHFARGTIRIEEKLDGGLEDIMYCVEAPLEGGNMAQVHFLRATALSSLGNMEDAKEALAKACMIAPKNEEWKEQLESWKSS